MGCGNRLWRCITCVPLVLMASVQDKTEITGGVGTNQGRTIHDPGDVFQACGDLNVVDRSIDRREGAENLVWRKPFLKRSVTLWIERFRMRHPSPHPKHDKGIRAGFYFFD